MTRVVTPLGGSLAPRVKVLVVDDEVEIAEGLAKALETLGYEVVGVCHDASEALVRAREQNPAVALVDIRLHGDEGGIQLGTVLRRELGVLVLFVTAFADEPTLERATRAAAAACLLKPVTDRDLRTAIETVLARHLTLEKESANERALATAGLASGLAHEINNPLAYVSTNLEFAIEALASVEVDPKNRAKLRQIASALADAKEGAGRVRAVVSEMTEFASAKVPPAEPVELAPILQAAWAIACGDAPERARWKLDIGELPTIEGDDVQLVQLFTRILQNAAQYRREGARHQVDLRARASHDAVVVEITDNGAGIAHEIQHRVFDPFFTTRGAKSGRGLGLAIAAGVVRAHFGEIRLESQLGVGTTVRVTLPREIARKTPAPAGVAPLVTKARPRVLVVDDEPAIARSIQRMLKGDYDVRTAIDGPSALVAIDGTSFDAILCDVTLPGMEGTELYSEIQKRHPALATRVVFVTGGTFGRRTQAFLDSLANKTIRKPFAAEEIRSALREALSR